MWIKVLLVYFEDLSNWISACSITIVSHIKNKIRIRRINNVRKLAIKFNIYYLLFGI